MKREIPPERHAYLAPAAGDGLDDAAVAPLRARFGNNTIAEYRARSARQLAGDTARDPMLWFLLATSVVFAALGEVSDAVVLAVALLPLVAMDFYLHRRTEASLKGLRSALATQAVVVRQGSRLTVAADDLVVGDLVEVSAGEPIPADGVVLAGDDLQADESSLTGEAYPVAKRPLDPGLATPGEENWAFAGTRLLTGTARVRILFTGQECLYGEIVTAAAGSHDERTPLQLAVARLVRWLLLAAVAICLLLGGIRLSQGHGLVDAFLSAAVLAVAAIPEEFPVALSFFLGVGAYRLARRKALVRRAVAVENIGRVDVICSDKTGTITEGRLRLQEARPAGGLSPQRLLELAAMAAREGSGDPLDEALRAAAPEPAREWTLVRTFPFTEARRKEVVIWDGAGASLAVAKGAPETIADLCELSVEALADFEEQLGELSARGQKVFASAFLADPRGDAEPSAGFTYAGLIGIADPVREGVQAAVKSARDAGIRLIMVTGDHLKTAAAIASEAGLGAEPLAMSGEELERRLDTGDRSFLRTIDVVARATPGQKARLVDALRQGGAITAVTGDGVNDVPALKIADIGIAMGLRGTQSAREVAAIVLMDDNFSTIVNAIAEGRQLFRNLSRSFAFLLMVHIPLVTTAAVIPLLDLPLLYLPVHIVVLELFIHPAAILGFQQTAPFELGGTSPKRKGFFDRREAAAICLSGLGIAFATAGQFTSALAAGPGTDHARTLAFFALLAGFSATLAVLSGLRNRSSRAVLCIGAAFMVLVATSRSVADWLSLADVGLQSGLLAAVAGTASALPGALLYIHGRRQAKEGALSPSASRRTA
jgi:Ca2+-transporting ATPase